MVKHDSKAVGVKSTSKSGVGESQYSLIDKGIFEGLCKIQCTKKEIAGVLRVTLATIDRFCEYTYGMQFKEVFDMYSADGHSSLRRAQYDNAIDHNNPIMQIWLGKQYLHQTDKVEETNVDRIIFSSDVPEDDEDDDKPE